MNTRRTLAAVLLVSMFAATGIAAAQYNQGPPPPPQGPPLGYQQQPWEAPPPEFAAAQQRGFHDGIEGAKRDFENHRPPNVNNRDEYRNPHFISPPDRHSYREGFRRGYAVAVSHIYGNQPRPY